MADVTRRASDIMKEYGIEVVDVRIKRTDLPPKPAGHFRKDAGRTRAPGQAVPLRRCRRSDKTPFRSRQGRAVILAEANRRSSVIRGEGDATAARVFAEAFSRAPDFYKFQRGLEALKKSFEQNSRIVITNDDPFLAPIR